MGFEEYCKKNQYSLYQTRSQAFTLGAASRQAEIDKIKSDHQLVESQLGQACIKWREISEKRQAEIDELEAKLKQAYEDIDIFHAGMQKECDFKAEACKERDELQKRIDTTLKVLLDASPTMLDKKAIKVLKGEENE